jgi:hypothetical protein
LINDYFAELNKSWTDLSLEEASDLIEKLIKMSWI